jgi:polyhydroxyalkanoate synthesis repressor PhaR
VSTDRVVIKKYLNRRLYDSSSSRYVNLDDIAALVRNGKDVQVVDATSGEDQTRVTLTQVIVEDARGQSSGLPLELLRQIIVTTDHIGQEFILWYLKSAFDTYQKVQNSMQDRFSQVQLAALSPLQAVKSIITNSQPETPSDANRELKAMRQRIAELEAELQKSKPAKKRGRTRT